MSWIPVFPKETTVKLGIVPAAVEGGHSEPTCRIRIPKRLLKKVGWSPRTQVDLFAGSGEHAGNVRIGGRRTAGGFPLAPVARSHTADMELRVPAKALISSAPDSVPTRALATRVVKGFIEFSLPDWASGEAGRTQQPAVAELRTTGAERAGARETPQSQPDRSAGLKRRWTDEEDRMLLAMHGRDVPLRTIAADLQRSLPAIQVRLSRLKPAHAPANTGQDAPIAGKQTNVQERVMLLAAEWLRKYTDYEVRQDWKGGYSLNGSAISAGDLLELVSKLRAGRATGPRIAAGDVRHAGAGAVRRPSAAQSVLQIEVGAR